MNNRDVAYALRYHAGTKHSEISVRTSAHYLDWENRPYPFKVYEDAPSIALPRNFPSPEADALDCVSGLKAQTKAGKIGIRELAGLLFFSAGLTRRFQHGGEVHYMRAASATGALYPIELYVVCQDLDGLKAGVYHFNPLDFALVQLRTGDWRTELATPSHGGVGSSPLTIVFTSLAWRNAWKYQARSYRHWFWDGGVIAANLLAVSASMGMALRVVTGFVDDKVNRLLGVRDGKEAALFLVPVELSSVGSDAQGLKEIDRIEPRVRPLSRREENYPEIWELQRASSLASPGEVKAWTQGNLRQAFESQTAGPVFPLDSAGTGAEGARLGEVILRRGSTRRFARVPVNLLQLSRILRASTRPLPLDFLQENDTTIDIYLIANAVDGLPDGSYFYHAKKGMLEQLKPGQLRRMSGYLCLEQPLFSDASVVFFLMTRLDDVLETFGNRGYRLAQLEGGIIAGRIYLSAYAQGVGASGSTFYDDAVTEFFSPHAKNRSAVIAVGLGVPAYKARTGKVLPQFHRTGNESED